MLEQQSAEAARDAGGHRQPRRLPRERRLLLHHRPDDRRRRRLGDALVELFGQIQSRGELLRRVGRLDQVAGVRLVTLGDGAERGVRVLEFRTGTGFAFDVLVDRAFDIGRCELAGRAARLALGGRLRRARGSTSPRASGFLRSWGGGLLTTCGLDHALFMAEDTAEQYHYPPKQTERLRPPRPRLEPPGAARRLRRALGGRRVRALGRGRGAAGVRLRRAAAAAAPDRGARRGVAPPIHDEVENVGCDPTPHMFLYHVNVGFPVVDEGSELLVPATAVEPRGDHSAEGYRRFHAPSAGLRRAGLRARARRRAGRHGAGGDRQPRARPRRLRGLPPRPAPVTTSSGGCSARARTSSASSRARTARPAGSTPASAAS